MKLKINFIIIIGISLLIIACGDSVSDSVVTGQGVIQGNAGDGFHVRVDAPVDGDGLSWEKAYNNLQIAINEAENRGKNKVYVAQGVYKPDEGTGNRYKSFSLRNGIEVIGGYSGNGAENNPNTYKTILSADIGIEDDINDNSYHVFHHPNGTNLNNTAKLTGVTITKGNADGGANYDVGGGMLNVNSSPALIDVIFKENKGNSGGGIYNNGGSQELTRVTFDSNTSLYGGGGLRNYASSPTLNSVTFINNSTNNYGGGMDNTSNCRITLNNVTFKDNRANIGAGLSSRTNCPPDLTQVTFTGNTATTKGGAIYSSADSTPNFNDNVLTATPDTAANKNNGYHQD